MSTDPVVLAEYDPRWPEHFRTEEDRIRGAIGPWVAAVEHIGSTAVPGLLAKPVIDIVVGLRNLMDARHCIAPMQGLGFTYVREAESLLPERRYFYVSDRHIHVVEHGSKFWKQKIRFRDLLRGDAGLAGRYAQLKRDLAVRFAGDRVRYSEGKSGFVEAALRQAP